MKYLMTVFLCGVSLAVCVARAGADQTQPPTEKQEQQQQQQLPPGPRFHVARGEVMRIDAEKKTFEIKSEEDKTLLLDVGEQTKFTKDEKPMAFKDLAVGNRVRLSFRKTDDGKAVAGRVFVVEKAPAEEPPPQPEPEKEPSEQKDPQ